MFRSNRPSATINQNRTTNRDPSKKPTSLAISIQQPNLAKVSLVFYAIVAIFARGAAAWTVQERDWCLNRDLKLAECPQFENDPSGSARCLPAHNQRRILICGDSWGAHDFSGPDDGIIHTCNFGFTEREFDDDFDNDISTIFDVHKTNYTLMGERFSFYGGTVHKFYAESPNDTTAHCAYDRFTWDHDWFYVPGTWSGLFIGVSSQRAVSWAYVSSAAAKY